MLNLKKTIHAILAILALCGHTVWAQTVTVTDAWARATVVGQKATGAFMKLKAAQATRLVSVRSAAAGVVEIHEMKMDQNVMKMAAVPQGLELPAGVTVELKPGGYHIMLMDLKNPLPTDAMVTLTLNFQDAQGRQASQELRVPVKPLQTPAQAGHTQKH